MTENMKLEEQKTETLKKLGIMLDYLGLEASLKADMKGEKIAVIISSEEAGRIIGRKGQTLESLQMLLNRMMFKADKECPRIVLDMDGYSRNNRTPGGDRSRGGRRRSNDRGDRGDRGRGGRRELRPRRAARGAGRAHAVERPREAVAPTRGRGGERE